MWDKQGSNKWSTSSPEDLIPIWGVFIVIIILSNHQGVSKDLKWRLHLKVSIFMYTYIYVTNMHACTHIHGILCICFTECICKIHKDFYSYSTSGIPSQQKYEVLQLCASGFKLQALSFLWPLYRILILSPLPCISSLRVMKETYCLKGVTSHPKEQLKRTKSELHRTLHPASKVSKKCYGKYLMRFIFYFDSKKGKEIL